MSANSDDEQRVAGIVRDWERAVQARDMVGTLAHHSDDVVMYDVPEPIVARGIDAYRETWELFFEYSTGGVDSFRLHDLVFEVGDTVAFAYALLDVAEVRCRVTIGLRKVDGEWVVVHEHHSSPWPDPRSDGGAASAVPAG